MSETRDIGERVDAMWEYSKHIYAPYFVIIEKELAFALKLKHHLNDRGETLDKRLIQYRGRELHSAIRRKTADRCAAPIYIETLPQALPEDSTFQEQLLSAEDSKWALEHDIRDPLKGFEVFYERAILGSEAARVWWVTLDWDPDLGSDGDFVFGNADPQKVFICPPFQDAWDPRCPWLGHETQMLLSDAKKQWPDVADQLFADDAPRSEYGQASSDSDETGRVWREQGAMPEMTGEGKGTITVLKWWFRRDPDKAIKRKVREDKGQIKLSPDEQYDVCTKCDYRSPTVGQQAAVQPPSPNGAPPEETPPQATGPMVCPQCLERGQVSPLKHITHEVEFEDVLAYPDGRLVIRFPRCRVTGYDDKWPWKAPAPPYMKVTSYEHPRDAIPLGETSLNMHMQIISNAMKIRLYDSVMMAPNIVLLPGGGGLKDQDGAPFQLNDEPWQIAYYDKPMQGDPAQHFQAPPVPAALFQAISVIDQGFRADIGTAEVSSATGSTQDLKSIPVGTVQAFVESGNVSTDHQIKRDRFALSIFFSVLHCGQNQLWDAARYVRTRGTNGIWALKRMRGASLQGVDVQVTAEPEFKARSKEELDAIDAWVHKFDADPDMAQLFGIPPSIAQSIEKKQQAKTPTPPPSSQAQILAAGAQLVGADKMGQYAQEAHAIFGLGGVEPPQGGQPGAAGPPVPAMMNGPQG